MSNRRSFLKGAVCTGLAGSMAGQAAASLTPAAKETQRPNILLLLPDQWRFDWMSGHKIVDIRTPNLDRLRERGFQFESATVASPVCAPSRACLASGKEYDRCRVPGNDWDYPPDETTFYKKLRTAGYRVLGCGKMDLAKGAHWWGVDGKWKINAWGFTDGSNIAGKWDQLTGFAWNGNRPVDPYLTFLQDRGLLQPHLADYRSRQKDDYGSTFPTPLPDDAYCDNWVSRSALELLKAASAAQPWFLQVNWPGPHDPEDITVSMEAAVRSRSMPEPSTSNRYSAKVNQAIRQNYTAMCENIDRGIGEILAALEESGQMQQTLIIFSSDHGEMLGDLDRWGKSVPYRASADVPLLISGPGIASGKNSKALVSSIDLAATCIDYGAATRADIDGLSLRNLLEGRTSTHRQVLYSGLGGWRMATDKQYKVVTGFELAKGADNGETLNQFDPRIMRRAPIVFDLTSDPQERQPLEGTWPGAATALLKNIQKGTYAAEVNSA